MTLKDAPLGKTVIVKGLHFSGIMRRKLLDMGITKGTKITPVKTAPFGDPLEVTIRGYQLALRKADAEHIEVE